MKLLVVCPDYASPAIPMIEVARAWAAHHGDVVVATGEGRCRGWICKEYRGSGRFGYDPLVLITEYNATFGELSSVVKSALSHRAKAVNAVRPKLWSLT